MLIDQIRFPNRPDDENPSVSSQFTINQGSTLPDVTTVEPNTLFYLISENGIELYIAMGNAWTPMKELGKRFALIMG